MVWSAPLLSVGGDDCAGSLAPRNTIHIKKRSPCTLHKSSKISRMESASSIQNSLHQKCKLRMHFILTFWIGLLLYSNICHLFPSNHHIHNGIALHHFFCFTFLSAWSQPIKSSKVLPVITHFKLARVGKSCHSWEV